MDWPLAGSVPIFVFAISLLFTLVGKAVEGFVFVDVAVEVFVVRKWVGCFHEALALLTHSGRWCLKHDEE